MADFMRSFKPDPPPQPGFMRSFTPDTMPDPDLVAHGAADVQPAQAGRAVDLAQRTGLAPSYVAQDIAGAQAAQDKAMFSAQLFGRPVLSTWAAQSPQHAALVKKDADALGQTEGWLSGMGDALVMGVKDIGYAEAIREYMNHSGPLAKYAMGMEQDARQYDTRPHGIIQSVVRALPQMVMYGVASKFTGVVGLGGLLYLQNKGVLARQIQLAQSGLPAEQRLSDSEIDNYAMAGSAVSAVTLAGLLGPLVRSFPGARNKLQGVAASTMTRAAATTIGQAAVRSLASYGTHTLMGALGMTMQATINQATVQKATRGDVNIEQLGREGVDTFLHVLPIAAAFGAYGPAREFLADRGRLTAAPAERAKLDAAIELARKTAIAGHPDLASDLFGAMGRGMKVFIAWRAAKKVPGLSPTDVAAAEAEQSSVAVPIGDYLGKLNEVHDSIKDDVKLSPDGATMNEAREIDSKLRAGLGEQANALLGRTTPDEAHQLELPLSDTQESKPPPKEKAAAEPKVGDSVHFQDPMAMHLGGKLTLANGEVVGTFKNPITGETAFNVRGPDGKVVQVAKGDVYSVASKTEPKPPPPKEKATPEGGVPEEITLYRGTRGKSPAVPGMAGARFMSPDKSLAELYAAGLNSTSPTTGEGEVSTEKMKFSSVLKADSWEALREKLGFARDVPVPMKDVINKAREVGHDAIAFKSVKGTEYVDLMPWLHEIVKQYGGTVEKWHGLFTPELLSVLKETGSKGAIAPAEHAARAVEALPIDQIRPDVFESNARKADKYIQQAAEEARSGSAAGAKASSPADVARLSTYELARDLNRAKAKRATEVLSELEKGFNEVSKTSANDKMRALMFRASPSLMHLFDSLMDNANLAPRWRSWNTMHQEAQDAGHAPFSPEAMDFMRERAANSLDETIQWFKEHARPLEFEERATRKLLENPKPWSEMTPPEARNLLALAKQIAKSAREENILRKDDAQATVDEVSAEIQGELRQNPSKGLPLATGIPSSGWRDFKLDANAANAVQLRPKNNLRQKSVAAAKWIFGRINDAIYVRDGFFRDVGEKWKAAFDAVPEDIAKRRFETYDLSDKLPVQGMEPLTNVPRQWLWKLGRHYMSAGNMDRIVSTSGWDRSILEGILFDDPKTKLTVPEWDYLQSLADVNEKYVWPKLKSHFEEFYGLAPPKTAGVPFKVKLEDGTWKEYAGGYEPLKRDARPGVAPQAEPTKGIAQYWGRDFQIPWTPGSARERVDNSHYLVNMDWDSSRATLSTALHWLAFDQPVRDVAKLLNDQSLAATMNEYMGEGRAAMVQTWLKASATRQAQALPEGMEIVGKMFGWQRRLALMQIVGGSARLAGAQLTHPAGLMLGGEVNPLHGLPALLSTFKPLTMADGEVRLFPNWNDALNYGKEVQHRADNAYSFLRRSWDVAGPSKPGPLGALRDLAQRTAGLYLHAVDRLTTTWAWNAFHNEAVAKGMEPFSKEAVDYADGRTQDVMPVHDLETAAPILTNRQVGGFLIMHGFKNALYNMRQDALAQSVKELHLAETPAQYGSAAARTAGRIGLQLAMFGGFAVMGKLMLGYGQQEGESKGQWLARDFLAGQSVDIPFIGGLGEPMAKLMTGGKISKRDFTLYGNPGMAGVIKLSDMLGNLTSGGREDYKKVFDGLEATLFFSGVPSRTARLGAEHLYEMLAGEGYDNTASDNAGRFFYTDKQWESIKRSLTPDED